MAEGFINITEGSGKKAHTWNRTIGANSVEEQYVAQAEAATATYSIVANSISSATVNDHVLQIMAGASLNVRVKFLRIRQGAVGTASTQTFQVTRLTTAGTGGTAITPAKYDNADAAAGATAMTLPTAKGTEGTVLMVLPVGCVAAQPTSSGNEVTWLAPAWIKPIIIPAGTANGIAFKNLTAIATVTWVIDVEITETSFL